MFGEIKLSEYKCPHCNGGLTYGWGNFYQCEDCETSWGEKEIELYDENKKLKEEIKNLKEEIEKQPEKKLLELF